MIDEQQIAAEAYRIWEKAGRPDGTRLSIFWKGKTVAEVHWMTARMSLEAKRDCSPEVLQAIENHGDGWQQGFYRGMFKGRNMQKPRKNNNIVMKDGKMLHGGTFNPDIQLPAGEYDGPIGEFPVRQDITVLPPDDPSELRLNFVIEERLGVVVINDYNTSLINIETGETIDPATLGDESVEKNPSQQAQGAD